MRPHLSAKQVDDLFLRARHTPETLSDHTYLDITDHMLTESHQKLAKKVLESVDPITPQTTRHKKFNLAYVSILSKDMTEAKRRLDNLSHNLEPKEKVAYYSMLSIYHLQQNQFRNYFKAANLAFIHAKNQKQDGLADDMLVAIWQSIQTATADDMKDLLAYRLDSDTRGWLSLRNLVDLEKGSVLQDPEYTVAQLQQWYQDHPQHPARYLFSLEPQSNTLKKTTRSRHVAVLLPYQGPYHSAAEAITAGIQASYLQAHPGEQKISFHDTSSHGAVNAYQEAQRQASDTIIGPLLKDDIVELKKNKHLALPTLALNYDPSLQANTLTQFSLSPNLEIKQLAESMRTQGYRATLILQDPNTKSQEIVTNFTEQFQADGGQISDSILLDNTNTNLSQSIAQILDVKSSEARAARISRVLNEKPRFIPQRRRDFDSILLASSTHHTRQIIPLLRYHFAGKVPIFTTSAVYSGHNDPERNKDLNGLRFFDTPLITPQMENSTSSFSARTLHTLHENKPEAFYENFRFHALGIDAYLITEAKYLWDIIPSYVITGATGHITKNDDNVIMRKLHQLVVQGGKVKLDKFHPNHLKSWQLILQTAVLNDPFQANVGDASNAS